MTSSTQSKNPKLAQYGYLIGWVVTTIALALTGRNQSHPTIAVVAGSAWPVLLVGAVCSGTRLDGVVSGGGTGWLVIGGNVVPGETIEIRFDV